MEKAEAATINNLPNHPLNHALFVETMPHVNTTESALAKDAKDFSNGPFKKDPNTFVWPTEAVQSIREGEIVVNSAVSKNVFQSAWSKRYNLINIYLHICN